MQRGRSTSIPRRRIQSKARNRSRGKSIPRARGHLLSSRPRSRTHTMYPDKPDERLSNTTSVTGREQEARTLHRQKVLDEISETSTDRGDDVDGAQAHRDNRSPPAPGPGPTREGSHAFFGR
eukprot:2667244-Pyramimonas_sp.AAC.1